MYCNNAKEGIKSRYTITWFVSYENTHAYIAPSLYQHHAFQMYSTLSKYIFILTQCSEDNLSIEQLMKHFILCTILRHLKIWYMFNIEKVIFSGNIAM